MTAAALPLLRRAAAAGGGLVPRVVNLASQAGRLSQVSPELGRRFSNAASADAVLQLADEFVAAVARGDYRACGWPRSMYGVSKLAEIAWTRVLEKQLLPDGIAVCACCPGYCATQMSRCVCVCVCVWAGPGRA